jgi:hypothetical protein
VDSSVRQAHRAHATEQSPESLARLIRARIRAGETYCRGCRLPESFDGWDYDPLTNTYTSGEVLVTMREAQQEHLDYTTGKGPGTQVWPCPRCAGLAFRQRVELAAWCFSDGALLALDAEPCPDPCPPGTLCPGSLGLSRHTECPRLMPLAVWLRGLRRWGPFVLTRAALAAGWVALEWWPRHVLVIAGNELEARFWAQECGWKRWTYACGPEHFAGCSTRTHAVACVGTYERSFNASQAAVEAVRLALFPVDHSHWTAPRQALEAARAWTRCPCEEHREACRELYLNCTMIGSPFNAVLGIVCGSVGDATHTIGLFSRLAGETEVREAIQQDLIGWAL